MEVKKANGLKYDNSKPNMALIPAAAALEEAAVWTYGMQKYAAFNWHNGIAYNRILASIERHLTLLKAGQDYDYENGLHNAAAIRCCCAMLIQFTLEGRAELDDRLKLSEQAQAAVTSMCQGKSLFDSVGVAGPLTESDIVDMAINDAWSKLQAAHAGPGHGTANGVKAPGHGVVAQDANETTVAMGANLTDAALKGYKIP